jgi:MinD-like ATPase involved in chromosome partitioning or flagellar assembly
MYVVTFYSFKGGVGRTMALINSAYALAEKGRRVLIIDFDLEAPGISTYLHFSAAATNPGLIDYVTTYLQTNRAPDVREYLTECPGKNGAPTLWVMPAGRRDRAYGARLGAIDWQVLYAKRQGYLMFEDLKQQLKGSAEAFDYVLIDSRTGHTDVGGICTRQLPDAVVLLFLPNEENIAGLSTVVHEIRNDSARRQKDIAVLFCPSNVPDLDDEEEILKRLLRKAQAKMRYVRTASVIHHYNSLALLDQSIFVIDRPKTRLAEEYRTLVRSVMRGNIEDNEGALARLEDLSAQLRRRGADESGEPLPARMRELDEIQRLHPKDGRIAFALAAIHYTMGALQKEYDALTVAINEGYRVFQARLRRAFNQRALGRLTNAASDLRAVVASEEAEPVELSAAAEALRSIDSEWFDAVRAAPALSRYDAEDRLEILEYLTTDRRSLSMVIDTAYEVLAEPASPQREDTHSLLVLSLIGAGRFQEAMSQLAGSRDEAMSSGDIRTVFNYAMAEWGESKVTPTDLLRRVVELDGEKLASRGTNYLQCIALTHAALGEPNIALKYCDRARREIGEAYLFSCWRYLLASNTEMAKDLDAIEKFARQANRKEFWPLFLTRSPLNHAVKIRK